MKFRILLIGAILGIAASMPLTSARAAEVVIKMATQESGDTLALQIIRTVGEEIKKRVGDRVDYQVFPGGQLGKAPTVISGLQQGTHIMTLDSSAWTSVEPGLGVFEMPFLFADRDGAKKVIAAVKGDLKERMLKKNLVLLAMGELGFRQISNNIRPIVKPEDLKGIKLRTPDSPFRIKMFRHFGANATAMSFAEVYMGLRQGVIDGQENPLGSVYYSKLYEVQKYVSMSNHLFSPYSLVASKHHWDKWPADIRKAVQEAADVALELSFTQSEERERDLAEKMKDRVKFNDIDYAAFKKAAEPLYEEFRKDVGEDFWQKAMAASKK
ncbi:MAG: TRAP transporter substrate-binding protein [Rhodospirillales bacterium]|nr:TRAP transporter substrate-binding protein [Rhodospirillales bacterium]